jgi:hypothetical protein
VGQFRVAKSDVFIVLVLGGLISLAISLSTPSLQAWWATTSKRRRDKRLVKLKAELERIGSLKSAIYRQEAFLLGTRYLVLSLAMIGAIAFQAADDVLKIHAHLHQVDQIFPRPFNINIPDVTYYRVEAIISLFTVCLGALSLVQAIMCFGRTSRLHVLKQLDKAGKELDSLRKYYVDNSAQNLEIPAKPLS